MAEEEEEDLSIEADLYIDESALDVEWLGQPTLMMRYGRRLAKAEKELARLKEKKKVNAAVLDRDIRLNPGDFKLTKVTEESIKGAIAIDEEQQELTEEMIDAQYEVKMLEAAIDSIKQRKDALQDLVRLYGQQYFAGPAIPRDLSFEAKQRFSKETSNRAVVIKKKTEPEPEENPPPKIDKLFVVEPELPNPNRLIKISRKK